MARIKNIFNSLKEQNQKAFIPFITAGDGGLDLTLEIMLTLVKSGADIIEIGVPFSDPMADGKVIAASHQRAVSRGTSLRDVFSLVKKFRKNNNKVALVIMSYLNPIEIYGYAKFASDAQKSGVDGILVIDNPPEEALSLKIELNKNKIDLIFLIAPTTTNNRIKYLANLVSGFVYFISLKGITGSANLDIDLVNTHLIRIKKYINLPICVGFGIKDGVSAKLVSQNADGAIIGSSIVSFIEKYKNDTTKILTNINKFSLTIKGAIK